MNMMRIIPDRMLRGMLLSTFAMLTLSQCACFAEQVTVDFEPSQADWTSYEQYGMRFSSGSNNMHRAVGDGAYASNGTAYIRSFSRYPLRIEHAEGRPFSMSQVDLAEYSTVVGAPAPVVFRGINDRNELVKQTFLLDGVIDGSGPEKDFQTFSFSSSFTNLIEVEVERVSSLDNLVVTAITPPPLPSPSPVSNAMASFDILFSYYIHDMLILGDGFSFETGFRSPDSIEVIDTFRLRTLVPDVTSPFHNKTENSVVYGDNEDASLKLLDINLSTINTIISLSEITNMGYAVTHLGRPVHDSGKVLFAGYTMAEDDTYYLFIQEGQGGLREVVTPQTPLPVGLGGYDLPWAVPGLHAIENNSLAFDTSLKATPQTKRLFASLRNGPIELIASEGDSIGDGKISRFESIHFLLDETLVIEIIDNEGHSFNMYRTPSGQMTVECTHLDSISPVGFGGSFSPEKIIRMDNQYAIQAWRRASVSPYESQNGIFVKKDGKVVKLILSGDEIAGLKIKNAFLLGVSDHQVFARLDIVDDPLRRAAAITASTNYNLPLQVLQGVISKEADCLYVPVRNLTGQNSYLIEKSTNLFEWQPLTSWTNISEGPVKFFRDDEFRNNQVGYYRVREIVE